MCEDAEKDTLAITYANEQRNELYSYVKGVIRPQIKILKLLIIYKHKHHGVMTHAFVIFTYVYKFAQSTNLQHMLHLYLGVSMLQVAGLILQSLGF